MTSSYCKLTHLRPYGSSLQVIPLGDGPARSLVMVAWEAVRAVGAPCSTRQLLGTAFRKYHDPACDTYHVAVYFIEEALPQILVDSWGYPPNSQSQAFCESNAKW